MSSLLITLIHFRQGQKSLGSLFDAPSDVIVSWPQGTDNVIIELSWTAKKPNCTSVYRRWSYPLRDHSNHFNSIRLINIFLVFISFLWILFVTPSHVDNSLRGTEYLVWLNLRKLMISPSRDFLDLVWFFDNGLWREVVVSLSPYLCFNYL